MIRYPAFDPPEYVDWQPDPAVLTEFTSMFERSDEKRELVQKLSAAELIGLYEGLVRNRLHDITLKRWVKRGVISKAWLGAGEEAATIGPVKALNRTIAPDGMSTDFCSPMIRNAGAGHEMGMDLADMFRGYLGTDDSPTNGRDLHIGDFRHGVAAPVSPVGDPMAVITGVALAFKMRQEARVALTWIGDGSTKSGVFHESMNLAAVQRLPLVAIIQDNQVALGTRLDQHHRGSFLDWPAAYGVAGWGFEGNNVLDAFASAKMAVDVCRDGRGPVLLVARTFRMGGHATHDEKEARATFNAQLFDYWGKRDPIGMYEAFLIEGSLDLESGQPSGASSRDANAALLRRAEEKVLGEIERAAEAALASAQARVPRPESAALGVYANTPTASATLAAGMLAEAL
jgi:TPP-dependent pyruvate/acetoin dehydrogenase alpha subunit